MLHFLKISMAFVVFCFLGHNVKGAPMKGRYMWVRCRPDGRNSNCVKEWGPWMNLSGEKDRLPSSAVQQIAKTSLDLEMQSGDGSGSNELLVESGSGEQWEDDWQKLGVFTADGSVQVEKDSSLEGSGLEGSSMEGSSSEVDYTDFVYPQSMTLPQNSLNHELQQQEDNMIL